MTLIPLEALQPIARQGAKLRRGDYFTAPLEEADALIRGGLARPADPPKARSWWPRLLTR